MEILFESNYKDIYLSKFLTSTKLGLPPNILEFAKIVHFHQMDGSLPIQSYFSEARNCNIRIYVFCHPQFSGVIQNIENRCTIFTLILSMQIVLDEILSFGRATLYKNPTKIFSSGSRSVYPLLHIKGLILQ